MGVLLVAVEMVLRLAPCRSRVTPTAVEGTPALFRGWRKGEGGEVGRGDRSRRGSGEVETRVDKERRSGRRRGRRDRMCVASWWCWT